MLVGVYAANHFDGTSHAWSGFSRNLRI